MRYLAFATVVLVAPIACDVPTIQERAPASGPHRPPDRVPPVSIDGARIQRIAITDQGDAAISVDALGGVRLWPSLDGKREPVQLAIPPPAHVAIAHGNAGEWVASTIDQAGNGTLYRLSGDGAVRGVVAIPGDVAIVQLAALDGGVLVARADQSIERYDDRGERLGRIVGDPGERFTTLAVRRGGAAVLSIAGAPKAFTSPLTENKRALATHVRFIVIGDHLAPSGQLAWGARRELPANVDAETLALAPNHRRVAVVDVGAQRMHVLDAGDLHEIGKPAALASVDRPLLGFVDNDDVVDVDGDEVTWWPPPAQTAITFGAGTRPTSDPAFGDGVAVAATQASLVLLGSAASSLPGYLGYLDDTTGELQRAGSGVVLAVGGDDAVRLDASLAPHEHITIEGYTREQHLWIDASHVVIVHNADGGHDVVLVDVAQPKREVMLATAEEASSLMYEPNEREVAFVDALKVHRVALDASWTKVTPLPDLQLTDYVESIQLVDPKSHDGIIAVGAYGGEDSGYFEWHDGSGSALAATNDSGSGNLVGFGEDGAGYFISAAELVAVRDHARTDLGPITMPVSIKTSDDGRSIAVISTNMLAMRDQTGHELWRRPTWEVTSVVFSADGRRVIVSTRGGLIERDALTGERLAVSCGYDFGLRAEAPRSMPNNFVPACED
jgi:hypothetical protein